MEITSFLHDHRRGLVILGIIVVPVATIITWLKPNPTERLNKKISQKWRATECNPTACDDCEFREPCQKLKH